MKANKVFFFLLIIFSTVALCSQEAGYTAKVQRVINGDTIELENGETVRYIGIDTPETASWEPSRDIIFSSKARTVGLVFRE